MNNPLLTVTDLPLFSAIQVEHIVLAVQQAIEEGRQRVTQLLAQSENFTWDTLCQPLAEAEDRLARVWSPIRHLYAVKNSPEWRKPYQQCVQLLTEYATWLGQHQALYAAYTQLQASDHFNTLTLAQRKAVDNTLRDFKLAGVHLPTEQRQRYSVVTARLSALSTQFEDNVLDATMAWHQTILDEALLAGLPPRVIDAARACAEERSEPGWCFTLEIPSYQAIMTYCDNRDLRYSFYQAYHTRASEIGPHGGRWDNGPIIEETVALRHELAQLLGFANYAEKSLAKKMADTPQQVLDFLNDLVRRVRPQGMSELLELQNFAQQQDGIETLQSWDLPYYSEKLKQHQYAIDDEQLRPYFPEEQVLKGLFEILRRLFSVTIRERQGVDTWHSQVRFFELYDQQGHQHLGSFYLDLYARPHKRGGAWMDECINARRDSRGVWQKPVTYLTCNFSGPVGDQPALWGHEEVITLFHEFGHGIHHMFTQVEVATVSGTHVPWDAIEVPSQFLENWCWQSPALALMAGHYQTDQPLPPALVDALLAAKNFQESLFILRQLEFSLFDLRLHQEYQPEKGGKALKILEVVKRELAVMAAPDWLRTPQTFLHIFSGNYAAGYYSYLWAEVLSADAFARFEEEGIFNSQVGREFIECLLSRGGSEEPLVLFKRFRGRLPQPDAFCRHHGIQ
jgi:oligopeptidase A